MDASIIIVSWNTKELLKNCLNSIFCQSGCVFEVFVVDNNSQDGTRHMLQTEFPQVKCFFNSQNRGFAAANNQAMQIAKGEFIILVNSDTELIHNDTLQKIIRGQREQGAGIAGPKLLNSDSTIQPSVRSFPTFFSQLLLLLKVHIVLPNLRVFKQYLLKDFDYTSSTQVDQVSGAFFSISRKCFNAVGLLDESFWIWFEEVDYCKRAKEKGFSIMYLSVTEVIHYGGQSFQKVLPVSRQKKFNTSLLTYAKKHFSPMHVFVLRLAIPVSLLLAKLTPKRTRLKSYTT